MYFFQSKYFHYFLLFLLVLPSIVWIFCDQHVWPWDPAWYGETSVDLYYKLTHSFVDWPKAMLTVLGVKAPAIAWIGQFFVPLSGFTGSIDVSLLLSVITAQWISLWLVYKIILQLTNVRTVLALLASLIMASAPLFVALGHHYFVESLQLLAVTLFVYIVVKMKDWNRYQIILALICVFSLAMLIKITSPLYIVVPAIVIVLNFFHSQRYVTFKEYFQAKKHVLFYVLACLFLLSVISWYLVNAPSIWEFMHQATSGTLSELYGRKADFLTKLYGWLVFFEQSFFISVSMWFVFLLVLLLIIKSFFVKLPKLNKLFAVVAVFSLVSVIIVLSAFSLQINEETRYLLPLLIYVTLLIIWFLYKLDNRWLDAFAVVVFLLQFVVVHSNAFGFFQANSVPIRGWDTRVEWDLQSKNIVYSVIKQTCNPSTVDRFTSVGLELPSFNANSIEYYATQKKLELNYQCYYTSLGYAETDTVRAYNRLKSIIKAPYFVTLLQNDFQLNNAFNAVSKPITRMIEEDPDFQEMKSTELDAVRIFKNVLFDSKAR